jgi:hypothetical protein
MDLLFSAIRIALAVYIGLCLVVYFRQSSYVYVPDRLVGITPGYFQLPYEDLKLRTSDGETIAAWHIPAPTGATDAVTVLVCHGNAGNISHRIDLVRFLHDAGMGAMVFDYHGYGDSTGKPTEQGTYDDARAAWTYLAETKGIPSNRIVVFGESLGGAVAVWLAGQVKPAALVVESSFISAPAMARRMFPLLPGFLCRFGYDSLGRIGKVACPVMVAHGRRDEMIPYGHGRMLFDAAREPKCFVELGGRHNDGGLSAEPDGTRRWREFLDKHVAGVPAPAPVRR